MLYALQILALGKMSFTSDYTDISGGNLNRITWR